MRGAPVEQRAYDRANPDIAAIVSKTRPGGLREGTIASRIPAQDLHRARRFYADKLGLEPSEQRPGGLLYRCASGEFALFESAGTATGAFTQMTWQVDDVGAVVRALRARGVRFEDYDMPGLTTLDGIATIEGNYPSKGTGERAAWFRDSEGNLLAIGQAIHRDVQAVTPSARSVSRSGGDIGPNRSTPRGRRPP